MGEGPVAAEEPTPIAEPEYFPEVLQYAEQYGIEPAEADRRFEVMNSVGDLQAQLSAQEAETFAGLWIQHEPEFRIVVAFTADGEETLRPYIAGKPYELYVEVRTHRYSLAELEAAQQEAGTIASQLGVAAASDIDVMANRAFLVVGNPALFLEEVRAAGLELPELVEAIAVDPENLPPTNRGGVETYTGPEGQTIYFPKQAPALDAMEALLEGTLILDENGCVRVESGEGEGPLVVWHYDFQLRIEGDTIEVLEGEQQVVARVGEPVRMGGGYATLDETSVSFVEACGGSAWILGDIESLEAQAIPDIYVDPFSVDDEILALFLQQSRPAPEESAISGELRVDEQRCLRVAGYAVIWPPDAWPREHGEALRIVRVVGESEETVAIVGQEVRLPGAERTPGDYRFFENKVPCEGPYWGVAAFE